MKKKEEIKEEVAYEPTNLPAPTIPMPQPQVQPVQQVPQPVQVAQQMAVPVLAQAPMPQQMQPVQQVQQVAPIQALPQVLPQETLERQTLERKVESSEKKGIWAKLWRNNKLEKANMVAVLFLRKIGTAVPMELRPENGFFNIEGLAYHERRDCTYYLKKNKTPLVVIREGELLPMGNKDWQEREIQEKCAICQDHVMKGIRHAERVRMGENMGGKKLDGKSIVGISIAVIVVLAFLFSYV